MGWRERLSNFDITRFTVIGWLIFFLSIAVGIGGVVFLVNYLDLLAPGPGNNPNNPRRFRPVALAGIACGFAFFIAAKFVLGAIGICIIGPKIELSADQEIARLQ